MFCHAGCILHSWTFDHMSKTPRTDAATIRIETPGFSGDIVFPGSAKHLETDLNAAHAQISALREALEETIQYIERVAPIPSHKGPCGPESQCDMECLAASSCAGFIAEMQAALSTPPPPVVPLEDVRPLVEALMKLHQNGHGEDCDYLNLTGAACSCGAESAEAAIATFTAKHPLP